MRIVKNLQNFLVDQNYYIDIYNDNLHVYRYKSLNRLSNDKIILELEAFNLEIKGQNLIIKGMDTQEILIKGIIQEVRFIR